MTKHFADHKGTETSVNYADNGGHQIKINSSQDWQRSASVTARTRQPRGTSDQMSPL